MSELPGKNLLIEDLFHAHWSKNHRQKSIEAELICRQKRQHLKRGQRPQKTHIAQLFGHKSERTRTKKRLSLWTFVVFLLESLCQVLLDIFALAFLLLNGIFWLY